MSQNVRLVALKSLKLYGTPKQWAARDEFLKFVKTLTISLKTQLNYNKTNSAWTIAYYKCDPGSQNQS